MKKLIILAAVFCFPMFALPSQILKPESPDSIVFDKLVHDYGTLEHGADGNCEFIFTNRGDKPLVLGNVRASCGCTAPSWTKEPVLPGQSGVIKVGYNTRIPGVFHKTITVTSNASNSQVVLIVKGNVLPKK